MRVKLEDRQTLSVQEIAESSERVMQNVEKVIVGKHDAVRLTLIAVLCSGHVLIEDVPGVVLADEINRATPKTQSALLEAMEENQVTVDGVTHFLPRPFLVMATQNPIEYEGTFPLPEAQLDRFMLNISMGYPSPADEVIILDRQQISHPFDSLEQILSDEDLQAMQARVREVRVEHEMREYIVAIVAATRQHQHVYLGASPRGSLALFHAAQAMAAVRGRDFVTPDDVKGLAKPVLSHRLIIAPAARVRGTTPAAVLDEVLTLVPVPGGAGSYNGRR